MRRAPLASSACRGLPEFEIVTRPGARRLRRRDHPIGLPELSENRCDGFAAQRRVNDDPLQVIVRLKKNAQCFARSCVEISRRARSSRAYSAGRLSLKGGTERWISSSPSRMFASTSCS